MAPQKNTWIKALVVIAVIVVGAFLLFKNEISKRLEPQLAVIEQKFAELTSPATTTVSRPPPLVSKKEAQKSYLTVVGITAKTNTARAGEGLPALATNTKLNAAAGARAKDMLAKQYFAHVSPSGSDVTSAAHDVGYVYFAIGENIALGNFTDDADLVAAWMNSPGHRANILSTKFTEIGVGVIKGLYDGHTTWIAVQVFGKPLPTCPTPSANLKAQIVTLEQTIDALTNEAVALRAELEATHPRTKEERDAYNQKVNAYNTLVGEINTRAAETRTLIQQYNAQVSTYNTCIGA